MKQNQFKKSLIFIFAMVICFGILNCSSQPVGDEDLSLDSSASDTADNQSTKADEESIASEDKTGDNQQQSDVSEAKEDDIALDDEATKDNQQQAEQKQDENQKQSDDLLLEEDKPQEQAQKEPEQKQQIEPSPQESKQEVDLLAEEPKKEQTTPAQPQPESQPMVPSVASRVINITNLQYIPNDSGGSILISADGPMEYTTRTNAQLKQFIIEVPNAKLPDRLKRNLNTKDIQGEFGAIDAYQNQGSNVARFVIQMREGTSEPAVQVEGNTLALVSSNSRAASVSMIDQTKASSASADEPTKVSSEDKVLASHSLDEYLVGNTEFYGKKISIELDKVPVVQVLKMITEESGINMVIGDGVTGDISLKLRQVPWDQALVIIMKSKKLGYKRQGNILRILPIDEIKKEEEDAEKLAESRKSLDPLVVKVFPVSYAKVSFLADKIKADYLTEKRGKVIGDERTNALVITDTEENLKRIAKLISSLDLPPPQVLIEGKIVEAKESFKRSVGIQWGFNGIETKVSSTKNGPVNLKPNMDFSTQPSGAFNFGLNIGTLDVLGSLNATLALNEYEEKVKVLSSPRIVTLTNVAAHIDQTTQEPLLKISETQTGKTRETTFKDLKLSMDVTPQITADASVILNIQVQRDSKGAITSTDAGEIFPVNSKSAKTTVLVKNGQTAVIGGVYQSDASESQIGVPYLKDIPVIGNLFKGTSTDKGKSELLIFLTPRILGQLDGQTINHE